MTRLPDIGKKPENTEPEKELITEKKRDKATKTDDKVLEVLPDDFSGMKGFFGV